MKKILAVVLAVVMLAAMAITASAYDVDLNADTISDPKHAVDLANVDGKLSITVTGGDPYFGRSDIELDASKVAKIIVYINYADIEDGKFQMFFTADYADGTNVSWSESASFQSAIGDWDPDANGYRAIEFYTDESGDWYDTITGLRFDITADSEGTATIDHMDFISEDGTVVYTAGVNEAAAEEEVVEEVVEEATEEAAEETAPAAQTADLAVVAIIALGAAVVAKKH